MVKPPDILLERDCTNDDVVEACSYGALNLKPENTSTKVLDYIYQSLSGATLATYPRSDGEATLAKR